MPRCSVIIPLLDRAALLRPCLDAVLAQGDEESGPEVLIVAESATALGPDGSLADGERVRVVEHPGNPGPPAARNAGAAAARGEFLLFVDPDTVPEPGWLAALGRHADAHPAAAAVGAKRLAADGSVEHAGVVVGLDGDPHDLYAGFPADHPAVDRSRRFQAVRAVGALIRREPFRTAGGFDAALDDGWADVDLCLRLGAAGREVRYCHTAALRRLPSIAPAGHPPPGHPPPGHPPASRFEREGARRERFAARWRGRLQPDDLRHYAEDGLLSVAYAPTYPVRLSVSPLLAEVAERSRLPETAVGPSRPAAIHRVPALPDARVRPPAPSPIAPAGHPLPTGPATAPANGAGSARAPILAACERPDPAGHEVVSDRLEVAGWALSAAGVRSVEAFVDGAKRGLVSYGRPRPELAEAHPDDPEAGRGGFAGSIPVGTLAGGEHRLVLRVRALDGGEIRLEAPFAVDPVGRPHAPILASIDRPSEAGGGMVVTDRLEVWGWALSRSGIRGIEALIDGQPWGTIRYGWMRPDVVKAYPDYPGGDRCGFQQTLMVGSLPGGEHRLMLRVRALDGGELDLETTFEIDATANVGEVPHLNAQYQAWLRKHAPSEDDVAAARDEAAALPSRPTISLILPVVDAAAPSLQATIDAVLAQAYGNWELCLAVASPGPALPAGLAALDRPSGAPGVVVAPVADAAGVAAAANAALAHMTGEFVGLLDQATVLSPLALLEVAWALHEAPETDLVYADEDKIDEAGRFRWDPFFKPDWSPALLLSMDYLGPFTVYRRSLIDAVGGFRPGFDGHEAYDLALRASERTDRVHHVASILSSRRDHPVPSAELTRPPAAEAERRALADALVRRGTPGRVEPGLAPGRWRVRYDLGEYPAVTVVLPTGGRLEYLRPCLDDLFAKTTYPNLHVLVVDNSNGTAVADLCAELADRHPTLRRSEFRLRPFNFSAIINHGVELAETPYLLILNDDITVVTPDWVEAMLEQARRPEVGVVGAKLLYPEDGAIQHAGVVLGPFEGTVNAFRSSPDDPAAYFGLPQVVRDYSAVTFACAMMRRSVYDEVGGLDAATLPVAFNDVDMCLRIREHGYRVVYTPYATLYHHESVTKEVYVAPGEAAYLSRRWGHVIRRDPFYNPNLTRRGEDFSLNIA